MEFTDPTTLQFRALPELFGHGGHNSVDDTVAAYKARCLVTYQVIISNILYDIEHIWAPETPDFESCSTRLSVKWWASL